MAKKVSDRADYEEIISHLQIIRTWAEVDWECGYVSIINPKCCEDIVKWIDDALELLKEQEAKVLTHDEAIVLPEGTPVWFEECTDAGQTFLSPMICHGNGLYGNRFMQVDAKQLYWCGRRFWTAKPDDEQRKAAKWDD